jgi:hypothetical protein
VARFSGTLKRPTFFKNILVGNFNKNHVYDKSFNQLDKENTQNGASQSGIDFHHLNQSERFQQNKTMKRLHQLSAHTAKEAINELRLMHQYFSTPHYLLKFREINQMEQIPYFLDESNNFLSNGNNDIDENSNTKSNNFFLFSIKIINNY